MNAPYVHRLLKGKVKEIKSTDVMSNNGRAWESGMFKATVDGELWLSITGFTGDEVADTKNHGGPEKAVFAYPQAHYEYWQDTLNNSFISVGGMGENFSVINANENTVCIGDTYQFGESVIQVSQPRKPCWKPARRFNEMDFTARIKDTGRTGWYFRVLKEGYAAAGQQLKLMERPYPQWTVAVCNELTNNKKADLALVTELASCELLAEKWRKSLIKRLPRETEGA